MSGATLREFAQINDAAAATTKKLQKYAILAEYFRTLADDDLRLAVRFAAGRTFAATDERVTAVGGAIVSDVVLRLLGVDPQTYHDTVVASGEIGEALAKLWDRRPSLAASQDAPAAPLTLHDLCAAFADLASTGNVQRKSEVLTEAFSRCADGREAAYLAKIIFGDLRTGVQEGVLHYAIAEAFQRDGKAVQRAQLLVGDLGEVAVLAKHDRLATAQFKLFHPIQFMLAVPQETAADAAATMAGRTFIAEDKLDGIRAQVHKQGNGAAAQVAIYTRTMDRTDASFPDVVDALRTLPGDFLLDGELVPFRDGTVLPFAHLQKRLGRKVLTPKIIRDNPCAFIAFDILYRDGELLMDKPLRARREALDALGNLRVTQVTPVTTAGEIDAAFCTARDCRNEGLILKDPASPYSPGRRGQMWLKSLQIDTIQNPSKNGGFFSSTKVDGGKRVFSGWLKLKSHLPTLDCVVTAAEYGHGKRRNSLSDYTFAVWDREPNEDGAALVNVGKAYSGVTDEEIRQLTELFLGIATAQYGRVFSVPPQLVLEIAFDQIQRSKRHASGYAFRFPRIKRIRWDKRPEDADRLSRVAEIYESSANTGRAVAVPDDAPADEPPKPRRIRKPKPPPEPSLFD